MIVLSESLALIALCPLVATFADGVAFGLTQTTWKDTTYDLREQRKKVKKRSLPQTNNLCRLNATVQPVTFDLSWNFS
jgi:hypothetical protein